MAKQHGRQRLAGRDPHEAHRVATPLELLYDLTYAVAFGVAADELAHNLAEGHVATGIVGFCFATFAISWAWINYSWFASAYDNDDWVCRLTTMVQMVGVLIVALGITEMFESVDHGTTLDADVMIAGYVVMRVPVITQWLRAARHDPARRAPAMIYAKTIAVTQLGWVLLAIALDLSVPATFAVIGALLLVEVWGPVRASHADGGLPWHPHHIAERYGLLVIITLGEGIIGTVASLNALVHGPAGWSVDAVLVAIAGVGITFGMWWGYFIVPSGVLLHAHRERAWGFGYGHMFVFGSLAAVGGGLHVAGYFLEHHSELGATATVAAVAGPIAVYGAAMTVIYSLMTRSTDRFHLLLAALTIGVIALALGLAASGVAMSVSLVVLAFAPAVTVVGYETIGHRHVHEAIERSINQPGGSSVAP
jgi:low temperature requirement protein LtrA